MYTKDYNIISYSVNCISSMYFVLKKPISIAEMIFFWKMEKTSKTLAKPLHCTIIFT